jgi:hypothetical protein
MSLPHDKPAARRRFRTVPVTGRGTANLVPASDEPDNSNFVLDEKSGLLLPEGARHKKRQPGFGADWSD